MLSKGKSVIEISKYLEKLGRYSAENNEMAEVISCAGKYIEFQSAKMELHQYLMEENCIEKIIDKVFRCNKNPVMFLDYKYYVVSYRFSEHTESPVWEESVRLGHYDFKLVDSGFHERVELLMKGETPIYSTTDGYECVMCPLCLNNEYYGLVAMLDCEHPYTENDVELLKFAAGCLAIHYDRKSEKTPKRNNKKAKIVIDLTGRKKVKKIAIQYFVNCGISECFQNMLEFGSNYQNAINALYYAGIKKHTGFIYEYDQYKFLDMLHVCAQKVDLQPYFHNCVEVLTEYDRQYNTELSATMLCYLKNERSIQRTAKEMYVHKNTIVYRMSRIQELTNIDFRNNEQMMHIYLTYLYRELYTVLKSV